MTTRSRKSAQTIMTEETARKMLETGAEYIHFENIEKVADEIAHELGGKCLKWWLNHDMRVYPSSFGRNVARMCISLKYNTRYTATKSF